MRSWWWWQRFLISGTLHIDDFKQLAEFLRRLYHTQRQAEKAERCEMKNDEGLLGADGIDTYRITISWRGAGANLAGSNEVGRFSKRA
jgi:hypothetical protein